MVGSTADALMTRNFAAIQSDVTKNHCVGTTARCASCTYNPQRYQHYVSTKEEDNGIFEGT
jgi:hypothetical protein